MFGANVLSNHNAAFRRLRRETVAITLVLFRSNVLFVAMIDNLPLLILVAKVFVAVDLQVVMLFVKIQAFAVMLGQSEGTPTVVLFHIENLDRQVRIRL